MNSYGSSWQSIWFTINENGETLSPGCYYINVIFYSGFCGEVIGKETLNLNVIDFELEKQNLIYTSWFHYDCLADIYNVEMFSDEHFDIIASFVKEAVKTGMNMLLLPAFTPPLDTSVGKERKTAQLVKVKYSKGHYTFDFSLMEKFVRLCLECGITYFEHCHMFTQWGARFAPKIIAETDSGEKRIFGWDTDSKSQAYADFLKAYFKAFVSFAKQINIDKKLFFHISDEPTQESIANYRSALNTVKDEIDGYLSGDALSRYKFYADGTVKTPIVSVASPDMDKFIENCNNLWVYYTGESLHNGYSNRIITTTGARTRVLGLQMYVASVKGFLHWGYNYYYDVLSHGLFNPIIDPCGYGGLPGTSYIVYPGADGSAIPSLRMKVFYEAINDYRALYSLEKLVGRKSVLETINSHFGKVTFRTCPTNEELLNFRDEINQFINSNLTS